MRIATQQVFLSNVNNINRTNEQIFQTQQQLSTGRRVLQPSDDPLAAAQIQTFQLEIARTEQFDSNIEVAERRLQLEETTIEQVNNLSVRLRELTLQARNGTLTNTDRRSIASEVDGVIEALEGLLNTVDVQGEFLFAGNRGLTEPYTLDQSRGRYVFNGDDGQRFLQIGPSNQVASTDSGFEIFERVAKVPGYIKENITQTVPLITAVDIDGGNATEFTNFMNANGPLNFSVTGGNLTVTNRSGEPVTAASPAVPLTNYALSSNPNAPTIRIAGVNINVDAAVSGTSTLGIFDRHNILNTALDVRNALREYNGQTGQARTQFNEDLDFALQNFLNIEERNVAARASIGGRINALQQQSSVNADFRLFTQEALSDFQDVDFAEAISRFQLQQTVLQASFSSFSRVQELSLFNFIN